MSQGDYIAADDYKVAVSKNNNNNNNNDDDVDSIDSEEERKLRDANMTTWEIFKEEIVMLKWRILVLACFLPFGSYWVYDFPGAIGTSHTNSIESLFQEHGKDYTQEMNQALYSVYSWPNTVLAFFGGILIDNILGLRKGMLLFTTLVLIGTFVFYLGVVATNYPIMLLGRFIFGLGGESLSVAQSAYVARWFRGVRGMALAFGITISFSRVGSSFNFLFSPRIATHINVQTAVLFGTLACALSLVACLALMVLDLYGEKKGIILPETIKRLAPGGKYFDFQDVKNLNIRFWIATAVCVTVYCAMFPFIGVIKNFFEVKYEVSQETASTWASCYQFVCAGGSTLIGLAVDKTGRFCQWIITASLLFTLCHLLFWLADPNAIGMMVVMGVAYSFLAASLWPAVPYVVAADSTGLAFGVMTACQNTGLAIYPLLSGAILDAYTPPTPTLHGWCYNYSQTNFKNDSGYPYDSLLNCSNNTDAPLPTLEGFKYTEILFCFTAAFGAFLGFVLWYLDAVKSDPPVLSCSAEERPPSPEEILLKEKRAAEREERRRLRREGNAPSGDDKSPLLPDGGINRSSNYMGGADV